MTRKLTAAAIVATVSVLGGVSATAASAASVPVFHPAFSHGGAIFSGPTVAAHIISHSVRSRIHATTTTTGGSLPTSFSLAQYTMPVGDQGSVNEACVSWAIDYAMFGLYANEMGESTAFAPMYSYSQIHGDNSAGGGGASPDDAINEANTQGVDTQSDYTQGNYNFTTAPTSAEIANAAHYKAVGYNTMYNSNVGPGVAAVTPIETELASGNPIALIIGDFDALGMMTASNDTLAASQVSWNHLRGLHEVLAVGYDSTGVIIQNSWGTSWGNQGFGTLDWDFIENYSLNASTIDSFSITGAPAPTLRAITPTPAPVTPPVVTPPAPPAPVTPPTPVTPPVVTPPAPSPVSPPAPVPTPVTPPIVKPAPAPIKKASATAPRSLRATVNTKTLTAVASWAAPASSGSAPITGYTVSGPTSLTTKGTSVTFTHLVAGRTYTIKVAAVTSVGTGAATSVTIRG
jgi:hypothetical protein